MLVMFRPIGTHQYSQNLPKKSLIWMILKFWYRIRYSRYNFNIQAGVKKKLIIQRLLNCIIHGYQYLLFPSNCNLKLAWTLFQDQIYVQTIHTCNQDTISINIFMMYYNSYIHILDWRYFFSNQISVFSITWLAVYASLIWNV